MAEAATEQRRGGSGRGLLAALPAERHRPRVAAAIFAAGLITCLAPYVWSESWRITGPSLSYIGFHLAEWAPFTLTALLVGYRGLLRRGTGWVLAIVLVPLTALLQHAELDAFSPDTTLLQATAPALYCLLVLSTWALDLHLRAHPGAGKRAFTLPRRRAERDAAAAAGPSGALWLALAGFLALTVASGRAFDLGSSDRAATFIVIFTSVVVEALPFVLMGALVSGLIEVLVPDRAFARVAGLPLRLQVPGAALAGVAMPVCECGSVPVARRLILKGMHPAAGIAFMLSSPVVNPIVLASTAVAYQGRGALEMVAGRALLGLALAVTAGLVLGRLTERRDVVEAAAAHGASSEHAGHDHDHHDHAGHGHSHEGGRLSAVVDHTSGDLFYMGKFVVAGGALAAALQTIVPQSVFTGVLTSPLVGALLLIGLAFLLSLCSEADAFVAVSFIQFPVGPQLAFLVFGPVLDIKLALLYTATFGRKFVIRLFVLAVPFVLAGSMLFERIVA